MPLVRIHGWVDGSTPTTPASTGLAAGLGGVLATLHRVGWGCREGARVDRWYRAAHGAVHWQGPAERAERAGRG
jgi:Ser/Thr protein kinase RdoA (MazF antagonist)